MGLYQEELAKHKPHLLQDGKLELTNMLLFKSARRVPFPATIDHLLNKMKTGNKAKHALSSFRKFVESVFSHLAHPEGQARFQEKTRREMEMFPDESYEADYQRYVDELVDKERNKLNLLSEQLKAGKPYQQFQGQVQADAQDRAEFEEEFQGKSNNLAGDSVGKYLMSECTAQFYQKMEDWVDSGYTPTPVEMLWLGKELGKRWQMKQMSGNLTKRRQKERRGIIKRYQNLRKGETLRRSCEQSTGLPVTYIPTDGRHQKRCLS